MLKNNFHFAHSLFIFISIESPTQHLMAILVRFYCNKTCQTCLYLKKSIQQIYYLNAWPYLYSNMHFYAILFLVEQLVIVYFKCILYSIFPHAKRSMILLSRMYLIPVVNMEYRYKSRHIVTDFKCVLLVSKENIKR